MSFSGIPATLILEVSILVIGKFLEFPDHERSQKNIFGGMLRVPSLFPACTTKRMVKGVLEPHATPLNWRPVGLHLLHEGHVSSYSYVGFHFPGRIYYA